MGSCSLDLTQIKFDTKTGVVNKDTTPEIIQYFKALNKHCDWGNTELIYAEVYNSIKFDIEYIIKLNSIEKFNEAMIKDCTAENFFFIWEQFKEVFNEVYYKQTLVGTKIKFIFTINHDGRDNFEILHTYYPKKQPES